MKASFYTFGCKVNQYETAAMAELLARIGWETGEYQPGQSNGEDAVVINSCCVTQESQRKLYQLLRRARRENPTAVLVLTGCMPQAFPERASALTEADIVMGNASRAELPERLTAFLKNRCRTVEITPHTKQFEPLSVREIEGHTRAFVKIQDGCNRFCSYCIIPYARGRVRSKSLDDIRDELTALAETGYREVVLVGINLTAYGQDLGLTLADAVHVACDIPKLKRVRLGSLEPDFLTADMIAELAKCDKLCPQFHAALQSGCDATLQRMRRRYTTAEFREVARQLRTAFPDCVLTTDVMVGFPGETEEEFAQSLAFTEEIGFSRLHVFAYSPRPGTPAATMAGQLPLREKSKRSAAMLALGARLEQAYAERLIGKTVSVLTERQLSDGKWEGYTATYIPVRFTGATQPNDIASVRITAAGDGVCEGTVEEGTV